MARLIDADAFSEQYGNYYAEDGPEEGFIGTVGELIAKQPTIEAEPVRHDPAMYPEWSAITKAIWAEIEQRMKGTVVHEFDYDGAIEKLTDKADGLRYHLHKPSAECSYFYGYVRALEEAKEIVRKARRSKRWKPKKEVKDGNSGA